MGLPMMVLTGFILWTLLGFIKCQDPQSYFFTQSNPAQTRFVPSFHNSRSPSFLSGSRNSLTNASPYSDPFFISDSDSPSAPSNGFSTGFSQHLPLQQTTRNPDYYDISPRPFGAPSGPPSFARPKGLRTSSSSGLSPLNVHQIRTNVPHQQAQFLAHFNEQNAPVNAPASTSNGFQPSRVSGGGRPFGSGSINVGTSSAFTRNRQFTSSTFTRHQPPVKPSSSDDELATPVQQQLPFRNTRTRFQPSAAKTSTTTSTTTTTSKPSRYNRFGAARSPASSATEFRQSTASPSLSASRVRLPTATVNKTLFQPRRPVFISREINRPIGLGGGRTVINHHGSNKGSASTDSNEHEEEDLVGSEEEDSVGEDILEQNHVSSRPKEEIFEKLGLHEANAALPSTSSLRPPTETSGALPPTTATSNKAEDDHTVILTSNFYLPDSFENNDEEGDEEEEVEDEVGDNSPTSKEVDEDNAEGTTFNSDYDYEYEDFVTTAIPVLQNPTESKPSDENVTVTETATEYETKPADTETFVPAKMASSDVELTTEVTSSPTDEMTTILPLETSTDYADDYEEGFGDGSGTGGSGDDVEVQTDKPLVSDIVEKEVVSVVTTKSVINGSTSVPQPVTPSTTLRNAKENSPSLAKENPEDLANSDRESESAEEQSINNTTESYVVIASIQTSRSINGARFLPFPAIEQEETKQTLSELERKIHGKNSRKKSQTVNESTETASSNELPPEGLSSTPSSTTEGPQVEDEPETTTTSTTSTTISRFAPNIRKFMPKTTARPKVNIDDLPMDDLTGLLPSGFKPRPSYKNKKLNRPTTSEPSTSGEELRKPHRNFTIGRSYKNSPNTAQDVSLAGFHPKSIRPSMTTTTLAPPKKIEDILSNIKFEDNLDKLLPTDYKDKATTPKAPVTFVDDISKFLPPGFKLPVTTTTTTFTPVVKIQDDISKFLPPGYKPPAEEKPAIKVTVAENISKFLPPGFKLEHAPKEESIDILKLLPKEFKPTSRPGDKDSVLKKVEFKDASNLLPSSSTDAAQSQTAATTTAASTSGLKIVFPKGLIKRPGHRLTTPHSNSAEGGGVTSPSVIIKKGPPTRATTEFTGWPTPSTTPISIEKLLEQSRTATIDISDLLPQSSTTSTTTTTTTTTTPEPPRPTKPGHCRSDCDLAGTIKIIDGVVWKPELLDHNTAEWKNLAHELEAQLNEVYSNAPYLNKWFKKVRIDSFSKGSVLVDYFVELGNITQDVDTLEIKKLFHQALTQPPLPVVPLQHDVENETDSDDDEDFKDGKGEKLVKETYLMGRFVVDPMSTDFIVIPKAFSPTVEFAEDDGLIPHWAIVLIVIGVGSFCFVVIFGVTVLLNRQKRAKKTPIPLTADMMNDLKVSHMGGADNYGVDDFYNIDDAWNDTKQPIKPKRFTNSVHGGSASNIYDSWRSTRHGDYYYDSHNYTPHAKGEQYPPDEFADVHQMYTYNHPRSRYQRDYDPDF